MGPISAAQVLVSWSHAGRLRSEAAFAALAGDDQLDSPEALHTIVVARLRDDPASRAYAARRTSEGKSTREIRRCLKRAVARQLFKLLERYDHPAVEVINVS